MTSAIKVTAASLLFISLFSVLALSFSVQSALGELPQGTNQIKMEITSPNIVHGIAGQIITINGSITNLGPSTIGGIAYISIVDINNKVPIDLEDWSAQKGQDMPSITAGQSLPLDWNIRLVKDGSYTVVILFSTSDASLPPTASSKIFLEVAPKQNLNPGNVLPVAFGVPALLMAVFGTINYTRGRKMGVY